MIPETPILKKLHFVRNTIIITTVVSLLLTILIDVIAYRSVDFVIEQTYLLSEKAKAVKEAMPEKPESAEQGMLPFEEPPPEVEIPVPEVAPKSAKEILDTYSEESDIDAERFYANLRGYLLFFTIAGYVILAIIYFYLFYKLYKMRKWARVAFVVIGWVTFIMGFFLLIAGAVSTVAYLATDTENLVIEMHRILQRVGFPLLVFLILHAMNMIVMAYVVIRGLQFDAKVQQAFLNADT